MVPWTSMERLTEMEVKVETNLFRRHVADNGTTVLTSYRLENGYGKTGRWKYEKVAFNPVSADQNVDPFESLSN